MQPEQSLDLAAEKYVFGSAESTFAIRGLRVPFRSVLATIGLGGLILLPTGFVTFLTLRHVTGSASMPAAMFAGHTAMLLMSLLLIAILAKGRFSDYGLRRPVGKRYALAAAGWGTFFGFLMTAVDYFPLILNHVPPPDHLSLAPASIATYMAFEAVFVGPTEEIPFRGLLQTFLMRHSTGTVRLGKYEMHVAGVILAMLFAVAHISSFWTEGFWFALGQQAYAFALGILYAYWREKSDSLIAPIIGHNFSDGVEYALIYIMTWAWR